MNLKNPQTSICARVITTCLVSSLLMTEVAHGDVGTEPLFASDDIIEVRIEARFRTTMHKRSIDEDQLSKQPLISPSSIHWAHVLLQRTLKHRSMASAGASSWPKPVGMDISLSFCHRFQCHQIECLHRAIMHDRKTERAFLAILLGNVNAPQG